MRHTSPFRHFPTIATAVMAFALAPVTGAPAYTLKTLYSFCRLNNCVDGANPEGALLQDAKGNLFGTAAGGGSYNSGVAFELTPGKTGKWKYKVLYSFCVGGGVCTDGLTPYSELIEDKNGNLYGTTYYGGAYGKGAVFELRRNGSQWIETVLYSFCVGGGVCTDGKSPWTGLTYAGQSSGALYDGSSPLFGATREGGDAGLGAAYELQLNGSWSEQVIHWFDPAAQPGPLLMDDIGNLYGVTYNGGLNAAGRLYRLDADRNWHQVVLYDFCAQDSCGDGSLPQGRPFMDANGTLFGTTTNGGNVGRGVAYRLAPNGGGWQYTKIYDFCSQGGDNCTDGRNPVAGLQMDADGDLYGAARHGGGTADSGTVFKLHHGKKWSEHVLYSFCGKSGCKDGQSPEASVILDKHGNLFGTTYFGGANGSSGTVFELTP